MNRYTYIIALLLLFSSCWQYDELSPLEYVKWIENPSNGLVLEKEQNELIFKLQYKPIEYVVASQERKIELPESVFAKAKSQMDGLQYFTLRLRSGNEEQPLLDKDRMTLEEYDQRVNYFSFGMQNDLVLFDGQDSLRCLLYHFERAYNLTDENTFLLGFDLPSNQEAINSKKLIYKDQFLGVGQIELTIDKANLSNIPQINLK